MSMARVVTNSKYTSAFKPDAANFSQIPDARDARHDRHEDDRCDQHFYQADEPFRDGLERTGHREEPPIPCQAAAGRTDPV